jgi:uncharacterized RDD family membrane protein YckC
MYQVIGKDGQVYGPVDVQTLKEWAGDRRLEPQTMMIDPITSQSLPASQMLADLGVFPLAAPPVYGAEPAIHAVTTERAASAPAVALVEASLVSRFIACFIDSLCGLPLAALAAIPFVGLLFAPLHVLYWLGRDSFFGGQSIGKRVMGIRAVGPDGGPLSFGGSATRNISMCAGLAFMIPVIGIAIGGALVSLVSVAEIILVLTTRKRIGDHLGRSRVVQAA